MAFDITTVSKFAPGALLTEEATEKLVTERILSGYASTWEPPERSDHHGEIVARGAFAESRARHDSRTFVVKMRDEHGRLIGVWRELREDSKGLWVSGYISKIPEGDHMITKILDGTVDSLSIAGRVEDAAWLEGTEAYGRWGLDVRELRRVWLDEVSPTGTPANIYARIEDLKTARINDWNAHQARLRGASDDDVRALAAKAERIAARYADMQTTLRRR